MDQRPDAVISLQNLRKTFTNAGGEPATVLRDVTFDVHRAAIEKHRFRRTTGRGVSDAGAKGADEVGDL